MAGRSERNAAREVVSDYHAAALVELFSPVHNALEQLTRGDIDPFEVDAVIFQYSRAAKALWSYCNADDVYFVADMIRAGHAPTEWWSRGAFQRR